MMSKLLKIETFSYIKGLTISQIDKIKKNDTKQVK